MGMVYLQHHLLTIKTKEIYHDTTAKMHDRGPSQLRGMGERTQQMYVRSVRQLSEHYHKSPDKITEEELRDYFLYVKNVKNMN